MERVRSLVARLNRRLKKHQRIPFLLVCIDPVEEVDPVTKKKVAVPHIKVASLRIDEDASKPLLEAMFDYLFQRGLIAEKGTVTPDEPTNNLDP